MEMRLRASVTRGYFFLLGALRLVNAASPRNIDQKKISSGTQGSLSEKNNIFELTSRLSLARPNWLKIDHFHLTCTSQPSSAEKL